METFLAIRRERMKARRKERIKAIMDMLRIQGDPYFPEENTQKFLDEQCDEWINQYYEIEVKKEGEWPKNLKKQHT